jgi:hypothetical protein
MSAVQNDFSWRLLGVGYVGLAVAVFGVLVAVTGRWLAGGLVCAVGIAIFIGFLIAVRRHSRGQGPLVMDFKQFGETFRWW